MSVEDLERTAVRVPSFASFYPDAYESVYRALVLTLRDPELTADATHQALARAYERWEQVSGYANPVGWVYRVALNWARSRFRRRARELVTGWPVGERAEMRMPEPSDPDVERALRSLPVGQRAVVVLRLYLDWSLEDVAAALDVPPGTVKSRLSRGLDRLRKRLEVT